MTVKCAAIAVLAVLFFGASGAVTTLSAQSAAPESVQVLKELVAEVRGLRAAIEQYANAQIQTQAVGELLDVQQRRVSDVTGRLDSARRELDGTGAEVRRITGALSGLDEQLRRASDPRERAQLEGAQRDMKAQLERLTDQDQMVRSRESELSSALGVEEAKWNELIDRLNQWLRR
jgi:chromosome segregation ATPase